MSASKRLTKEISNIRKDPHAKIDVSPRSEDDLFHWDAVLKGPEGSPYEGGSFKLSIDVPTDYPFKAPAVKFVTKIYHPSIRLEDGSICGEIFTDWRPSVTIIEILKDLLQLLAAPDSKSPLEADIAKLMNDDYAAFVKKAQDYTKTHAM
eukprot:TRINITY_DN68734_c0_g1_i1.p1 TRINITY_DN68734_c0_g1~~TRINITY_DN68734_c0_g1_i1.p1  ORF type:complete len:150 (-),score=27.97 TRINITY_DN68734_c0_g1_i1:130-579(-)